MYLNPGSRLDQYEDHVGIPRNDQYLLAEIAMRRLLNRTKETRLRTPLNSILTELNQTDATFTTT